jgi:WD40 repeat protein
MKKRSKINMKSNLKFKIKGGGKICKEIQTYPDNWNTYMVGDRVNSVTFHDNGKLLSTVNYTDKIVKLWSISEDLSPEGVVSSWRAHMYEICDIMFKGRENLLYTNNHREIKTWNFNRDGSVFNLMDTFVPFNGRYVSGFTVHPILPLLLIGSGEDIAILWKLAPNGQPLQELATLNGDVVSVVAFHPKLPFLAIDSNNGYLKLGCLTSDGSAMISVTPFDEHNSLAVINIVFHPTDNIVCTGTREGFKLWSFSADGLIISRIGNIQIANSGISTRPFKSSSIAFHPSGNFLVTSSDHIVQLWRLIRNTDGCRINLVENIDGYSSGNVTVSFHPSGKVLSMNHLYNSAKLFDCTKLSTEWQLKQALKQGLNRSLVKRLTSNKTLPGLTFNKDVFNKGENELLSRTQNVADLSWNRENKQHIRSVQFPGIGHQVKIEEPTEEPEEPIEETPGEGGARSRRNYKKKLSRRIRRINN